MRAVDKVVSAGDQSQAAAAVIWGIVSVVVVPEGKPVLRTEHPIRLGHVKIDALRKWNRIAEAGRQSELHECRSGNGNHRR